ncbi:MAG TPA: hypothetical protein VEP90_15960 [Methylomirabilota bacterium]|nr:hypothetical protein [Methylomirabilota bacterium]
MWILIASIILIGGGFFVYCMLVDGDGPIDDDNVDIHEYENDVPPHPVVEKKKEEKHVPYHTQAYIDKHAKKHNEDDE